MVPGFRFVQLCAKPFSLCSFRVQTGFLEVLNLLPVYVPYYFNLLGGGGAIELGLENVASSDPAQGSSLKY